MFPWSPATPAPGSVGAAEEEGRSKLRVAVRLAQPHDRLPPASNPVSDRIRSRIRPYGIPYQIVSDAVSDPYRIPTVYTVEYEPFIKSQLASHNQL